jgi:hypothetical protein
MLSAAPITEQFLVHETTALEESAPAIAVIETSGGFVAAWTSFEQPGEDESGLGVYVQRFQEDGTAKSASVLVNTALTGGDQFAPDVAVDAAGNFVVVWQGQDDDGAGVYAQRYAADGTPDGGEVLVNVFTTGDQSHPTVAMDNDGNYVIAWQSDAQDGDGLDVYARRFDDSGNPREIEEFLVNTTTAGDQAAPTAATARENGNFVIAWEGDVEAEHASVEIFAHVYDLDAMTIRGEFQVNTITSRDQVNPDAAMDADGDIVVTWTSEGIPGSGSDVFAQRLDSAGIAAGGEFRVNEALLQGQVNSVVGMDTDGDFFITWQSSHQDEFSWGIFGRAYDSGGDVLTTDVQVNTYAEQPQTNPAVGSNSEGQVVTLWLGLDEDHATAVHAQRYQLPGTDFAAVGGEIVLANYLGLEDTSAAAAVNAQREFLVVWQSYGEDGSGLGILGRRLDADGAPLGDAFVVNSTTDGNQINPDVAMDNAGNAVVVWESADADGHGIYARRLTAAGVPVGPEFLVNTVVTGQQTQPAVAMNSATGDFVVVWQGPDAEDEGIYAQRFDAAGVKVGVEFQVNAETDLDQVSAAVSMNAAGQFAVTWVSDHRAVFDEENDSEKSIFLQWYDADGVSTGPEQLVHTIVKDYEAQEYPDIALDADGNMIVVWQSITQDGSAWGVYGRQFLADKTAVQPAEFQINQTTAENQRRAKVVSDPLGNFTVSWQSDRQDQAATAIISRQYNADGTAETDEMIVNTWELGPQILPVMAMTSAGDFGVFWDGQGTSRTEGIHGRIYEEGYVPPEPHITVTPIGDQILVSEAAGLEQSFPAVAVIEGSGNYVAAWTSFEQAGADESGLGVYAQTFLADGTPDSDAFLVNVAYTNDDQTNPAVAVDEDGNFVVVWQSLTQDGSGFGIYAQRYLADGTPDGAEFQVNTFTSGDQANPTAVMDNAGNFLIAWQSQDGDGLGIYARRYESDGTALEAEEFLVNTTEGGNQSAPVAALAREDGSYVIGWQSEVLGDEGEVDVNVLAHLYHADGSTLLDEFTVNTILEKDQVGPSVAMGPSGDFVFTWTSEGQVGSGADVYARQFNAAGTGLGDDFRVNVTTRQGQQYPAVGMDADGNFIVSWQSSHQDGFSWGIFASVYDAAGEVVIDEFQVNTNVQGPQTNPVLSANSEGTAVVLWLGLDATHQSAVHAQRYQLPQGGSEFAVGPEGEIILNNYAALEEAPASAAVDADGNYVVAWQSYGEDGSGLGIFARRFDATGTPLGDAFLVNTTTDGNQSHPAVASDASGNFFVVWQAIDQDGDGYGIFSQRYDSDGNTAGVEFQVNTTIVGHQGVPSVAMNPVDGSAVIAWQGPDADGLGIFGQRYSAAGAPEGGEFQLNAQTALDQVSPAISMNAAGQFAVVWVSDHRAVFDPTDTEKSIFVQWYDADGGSVGEEALVHSIQPEFEAQEHPDVALDANGNFVVAWQSINQDGNTWGVFARQFLADKTPVQPIEFQINQTVLAPQRHSSVISDAEGNFVVAWQAHKQDTSGPGVMARVYDSLAVAQTDEFLVPTWDQGPQTSPVMAMAPTGNFGIFWTGHGIERAEGVHGRIYSLEQQNVVPHDVSIDGPTVSVRGKTLTYAGSFIDPDTADTHEYAWLVTDASGGIAVQEPIGTDTFSFVLTELGEYTVQLTVTDAAGESGIGSTTTAVQTAAVLTDPDTGENVLYVGGSEGRDYINLKKARRSGDINVNLSEKDNDVHFQHDFGSPVDRIVVYGLEGSDRIRAYNSLGKIPVEMYGGHGNDRLYGGLAGDILNGGPGNDRVFGGFGNDVLVGGDGTDRLFGGRGSDVVIGGKDSDEVVGGGRRDGDLLIAGWTIHDQNRDALSAIFSKWNSGEPYEDIVDELVDPGGLLEPGVAAFDDGVRDLVWGSLFARDLVFADVDDEDGDDDIVGSVLHDEIVDLDVLLVPTP